MIFIYIFLFALSAFPLILTIVRMLNAKAIKKHGVKTHASIKSIQTKKYGKGGTFDHIQFEYRDSITGNTYTGKATSTPGRYRYSDLIPVNYLPGKPSKYSIDGGGSYWPMLIFCILLFLFVIFAIYKIDEMVTADGRTYHFSL